MPLFATICSAVNGLLVCLHLESDHHCLTAATSAAKAASSLAKSAGGAAILFEAIMEVLGGRVSHGYIGGIKMMSEVMGCGYCIPGEMLEHTNEYKFLQATVEITIGTIWAIEYI